MEQRNRIFLICAILALSLGILIWRGYGQPWTGFADKELWDWMDLLIVPLVLAIGALLFNRAESKTGREIAAQRAETQRQSEIDRYREAALESYLDRMSELLLEKSLRSSDPDSEVRDVARTRTLTTARRLDGARKAILLQFLQWSRLLEFQPMERDRALIQVGPIVNLVGADFRWADLDYISLEGACLTNVRLNEADLIHAVLREANLNSASLKSANLYGANLANIACRGTHFDQANLKHAVLVDSDLAAATLKDANLTNADLRNANLGMANLRGAILRGANLTGARLTSADLTGAHLQEALLDNADLTGAKVTRDQLDTAKSLSGAILPDNIG